MALDADFLKSIGLDDEAIAEKLIAKTTEDETGLVNKRDELLGKVTDYKGQLSRFEGVDPDEYRTALQKLKEYDEKHLMEKGDFEPIRQKLLDQIEETKNAAETEKGQLRSQLEGMMVDSQAAQAISEAGGNLKLLMPIIKNRVAIVDDGGKLVLQIKSEDGKPALNSKAEPMSLSELMEEIKADESFSGAFASSGLSGGGARPSHSGTNPDQSKVFGAARMRAARAK